MRPPSLRRSRVWVAYRADEIEREVFSLAEAATEKPDTDPADESSFASIPAKFDQVLGGT